MGEGASTGWGQTVVPDARFDQMIAALEQSAAHNSSAYRRRVVLAGLLGYVVILGLLALLTGLTIAMIVLMVTTRTGIAAEVKMAIVFGLLSFALIKALWVTALPPEGVRVEPDTAPALFDMIEWIRAATGGPAIHDVRIIDQMNAAIVQDSGSLFLGARNRLYLGLPLLSALSAVEVEAVIAHEFGHFVGDHGHASGFVYRVRQRWAQVEERLPDGIVAGLLRRFFGWYGPWFAAYSFTLARRQEYEADHVAATAVGPRIMADALLRVAAQAGRFDTAWRLVWDQAPLRPDPPRSPLTTIASVFTEDDPADQTMIDRELSRSADRHDTHPTLAQRLAALSQSADLPARLQKTAAEPLLGETLAPIIAHFDEQWHDWADALWADEHAQRQADEAERQAIADQIAGGATSRDQLYRYAALTEAIDTPQSAAQAYAAVLALHPNANDARFRQGDMLLATGDDAGIDLLLAAANGERALLPHAYRHIVDYLLRSGRPEEAAPYFAPLEQAERMEEAARHEANGIDETAQLRPLSPDLRERLTALIDGVPGVATLHAALRDMDHADAPQIVFVFSARKEHVATQVLDALIEAMLPAGDLIGLERSFKRRWLFNRIRRLPDSSIVN